MSAKVRHRIIIDTNLWISFLLTKDYSKVDSMLANNNLVLLFSQELIDEFVEVAQRPKLKKYFSVTDLQELLIKIRTKAEFIAVTAIVDLCRDPKRQLFIIVGSRWKSNIPFDWRQRLISFRKDMQDKNQENN